MSGEGLTGGSGMLKVQLDLATAQMFQAFTLFLQQQQQHDRKEALATKALQAVVGKMDQFDGRNVSKYLRYYVLEMELNRVPEKELIATFALAAVLEIKEHVKAIQ